MNKKIARRWVKALLSGKYKQGRGELRPDKDRFCCLGVLCDITRKDVGGRWTKDGEDFLFATRLDTDNCELPPEVRGLADIDHGTAVVLMTMNDTERRTFRTIAKRIAKEAGIEMPQVSSHD